MLHLEFERQLDSNGVKKDRKLDVLLPAIGSAGDVHPVIELGIALKKRGHQATVIANAIFEEQACNAGLDFVVLGTMQEAEAIFADPRLLDSRKSYECVAERVILPYVAPLYHIIRERQRPNTVVAATALCFGARVAQEKLGVHLATIQLQPSMFRSLVDGGLVGRMHMDASVPRIFKKMFFWLLDRLIFDRLMASPINAFRASLGLPPVSRIFNDYINSPEAVLALFPEWFAPPQPDWPKNTHLTGFLLHDDCQRLRLSDDVNDFLAAGPPPVVFTPGSSAATLSNFFRESVAACRIGGYRAMLVTNFPEQVPANLPAGVRAFSYLPFSQVLPFCSALVYAGGIGTMAQAIKAGIPHLVVPHVNDQPDNALRIERLGLGSRIYPEQYKAARVAQELNQLLSSPQIKARCAKHEIAMDSTAALDRTCDLVENLAGSGNTVSEPGLIQLHKGALAVGCD